MKKILIFQSLLFLISTLTHAQDVIILRNGEELKGKVIEITLSEIKYKKTENLEGPLISIAKDDVYAIKYENGGVDLIKHTINNGKEKKPEPNKVTTFLYAGGSFPISYFADKQGGSALTGYTVGVDVKIKTQGKLNFTYGFNYTRHPFKFEASPPNNYTLKGHFDIATLVVGLRYQTVSSRVQFYVGVLAGANFTSLRVKKNIGSAEALGFAFYPAIGIVKNKFTLGAKYLAANPRFRDFHNELLPVKALQLVVGLRL